MALERGALVDPKFADFSKKYVMFLHVTSRVPTDKYQDLLEKKGGQGFPHLVWMDQEGTVLATQDDRSVDGFEATGKKAQKYVDLKKKAAGGDKVAKIDLLIADVGLGKVKLAEADKQLAGMGPLSDSQKKELDTIRVNVEVREIVEPVNSKESMLEAGKKLLELKKSGKPAPTGENEVQMYWIVLMGLAEEQKDIPLFEEGLTAMKAKFGSNPNAARF